MSYPARCAVAGTAALALLGTGGVANAATSHAKIHSTPRLAVAIDGKHTSVHGPRTFRAGRVSLSLTAKGDDRELQLASFGKGYSFADFRADVAAFGKSEGPTGASKAGLHALNHALSHTTLLGGIDAANGHTVGASIVVATAGRYVLYNDSGDVPTQPTYLTVTGPAVRRATPTSQATVIGTTSIRFAGAATLPAKGVITFRNSSTESPHLLALVHVKPGTTRQQVLDYFTSGSQKPPAFALSGSAGTDSISPGHSQTISYNLPKGTYVEVCFFPDPKTGMPHAFMGMIRVVTLA